MASGASLRMDCRSESTVWMLVGLGPLNRLKEVMAAFLGGLSSAIIFSPVRLPNVAFEARSVQTPPIVERGGGLGVGFFWMFRTPLSRAISSRKLMSLTKASEELRALDSASCNLGMASSSSVATI